MKPKVVILALGAGSLEIESDILELNGLEQFKPGVGFHGGLKEPIWIINVDKIEDFSTVVRLAGTFKQESFLVVRADRTAYLCRTGDKGKKEMGKLRSVCERTALKSDSYTYDLDNDVYFVTSR